MKRKKYLTKRFEIRPYTLRDYPQWFILFTSLRPKQNKFDLGPFTRRQCTRKSFQAIVERHKKRAAEKRLFVYAIFDRKTKELVGSIDFGILYRGDIMKSNLGYEVFNKYWRQGIAYEVLSYMVPQALMDLKINRFEACIDLDNKASIGLCKKLGLRSEGVRKNYYFQNGQWADQKVFVADRALYKLAPLKP